jgi:hypothetical protein
VLTWIAMLGMVGAGRPVFLDAQREVGHAYGAGPAAGARDLG